MNAQKSSLADHSIGLRGIFKTVSYRKKMQIGKTKSTVFFRTIFKPNQKILAVALLLFNTGCAINYKPANTNLSSLPTAMTKADTSSVEVLKSEDTTFLFNNAKIKKQLLKKGYSSYIVKVINYTADTLSITGKTLFAIKDYEPIAIVPEYRVLPLINFNRGLFLSATAYGLISPFAYAGRKIRFSKGALLVALPIVGYGLGNSFVAYRSVKRLKKVVDEHYLVGKKVVPHSTLSGFVIVHNNDNSLNFAYRTPKK